MPVVAPRHLNRTSRALHKRLVAEYGLQEEAHSLEVLRLGLEALDRADEARTAVAAHGLTYIDRFGAPRARPELALERDARLAAVRCFRELALDGEVPETRPPRIGTGGRS